MMSRANMRRIGLVTLLLLARDGVNAAPTEAMASCRMTIEGVLVGSHEDIRPTNYMRVWAAEETQGETVASFKVRGASSFPLPIKMIIDARQACPGRLRITLAGYASEADAARQTFFRENVLIRGAARIVAGERFTMQVDRTQLLRF